MCTYHGVAFKTSLVAIMKYFLVERIRVHAQIANAHAFEQQPECLQVLQQVLQTDAKCGRRYRMVDEMPGFSRSNRRLRAKIQIPRVPRI
jgi:hypothetical protein